MPATPPLLILAMDQRDSIEQKLYELDHVPTPAEAASIAANKLLAFRGLLDAVAQLPEGVQPAFLVDEQYGASPAVLAAADDRIELAMPLEASGQEWFDFAYGHDWREHAAFFGADHAKVLIRDNPGLDQDPRTQQANKVAEVSAWSAGGTHELIVELLVPATDDDLAKVGGDTDRYDRELRPGLTVQVMEFLQDHGVEPAIWKIEGLSGCDLRPVVLSAGRDLALLAEKRDVEVRVQVHNEARVRLSEVGLRRCLVVLIDNAVAHSPDGAVVSVDARVERGRAVVVVADQGGGIRGIDPDRIFERFAHAEESGRRRGFGIGLALVRDLAVRNGGAVDVVATSDGGTTMRLELPVER